MGKYMNDGSELITISDSFGKALGSPESTIPGIPVTDSTIKPLGHQTVTVTTTAQTLSSLLTTAAGAITTVPATAKEVWFWPVTGDVVFTLDGSTPVKAVDSTLRGSFIAQDMQRSFRLTGSADIGAIKFIASSNVVLSVEFRG